ncbi:hypothetical protein LDENG_00220310 [Lucifuga dentata]|nr:hypothetical protein LDENG_00220310 [Lucifuga dentata]
MLGVYKFLTKVLRNLIAKLIKHSVARSCSAALSATMASSPTDLENCLDTLINVFHRYADKEKTLDKKDLRKLLENELPTFLHAQQDPKIVENIIQDMDQNKDQKMNFEEFVSFIAGLSIRCEQQMKKQ